MSEETIIYYRVYTRRLAALLRAEGFQLLGIDKDYKHEGYDNYLFEESVNIDLSKDNYKITFKGIIDKIMYKKNNDSTLISIIDYKTGNPNLNLNNIITFPPFRLQSPYIHLKSLPQFLPLQYRLYYP